MNTAKIRQRLVATRVIYPLTVCGTPWAEY
jgi:hypothetical protein